MGVSETAPRPLRCTRTHGARHSLANAVPRLRLTRNEQFVSSLSESSKRRDDHARQPRLLADIGGTNSRFGWQAASGASISDVMALPCAKYASLADAMVDYLCLLGRSAPPACSIAIATAIVGDTVAMTNHPWKFSIAALRSRFSFERMKVLNDFTALALALPSLHAEELRKVGGGPPVPASAIGLIGPGTGLGVSGLLPDGRGGWVPLNGEGGHVTLAGCSDLERVVLQQIGDRYGHASAERVVSGQGLADIHRAVRALDAPGAPAIELDAAAVTAGALSGDDPICNAALDLFCGYLGTVAGNLALTLGARGGLYIGGGIVPRLGDRFNRSPFRTRFETKGRFRAYLAEMPVFVIDAAHSPALLGASRALDGTDS
jgi:glucokinase